jgi:putative ABC transport system ATP-binding protein
MLFLGRNLEEASVEGLKLLERLDLVKYKDRFPFELSGGQQQRVGIARALANNPPIIIADEPLGNLDSVSAKNVLAFLKELNEKDGRTIIMVTHEAWSLQDVRKVFYMKDGAIIETKEKSATTTPENLAAVIYKDMLGPNKEGAEHEVTKTLLSHFLMRGYTTDEIIRFEEILKKRMSGAIDHDEFRLELDKPYKKGGVGLWKQKAQRVADYIEEVINGRHTMETIFKMLHDTPELSITDEVNKIALWISEEYKGQLSVSQNVLLREYVTKRIKGLYTADDFQHALDRPARTQGLGLSMRATQLFSERMEALLIDEHGPAVNLLPHTQLNVKEI